MIDKRIFNYISRTRIFRGMRFVLQSNICFSFSSFSAKTNNFLCKILKTPQNLSILGGFHLNKEDIRKIGISNFYLFKILSYTMSNEPNVKSQFRDVGFTESWTDLNEVGNKPNKNNGLRHFTVTCPSSRYCIAVKNPCPLTLPRCITRVDSKYTSFLTYPLCKFNN